MRSIYPIFFIILSFACGNKEQSEDILNISWENFKIIEVESQKYYFEEILNPSSLGLQGENVLLSEAWRVPEEYPRIHLVNSSNWSYLKPKGKHGLGPLEITDAAQFLYSANPNTFWIYNMNGRKLVEFSINDTSLLGTMEWKLPEPMANTHFIEKPTDSTFLTTGWYEEDLIIEFDSDGNLVNKYGKWELIDERADLNLKDISQMNSGWLKGNPDVGLYIRASLYRDILKLFDYKSKEFITIYGPNPELPLFELHETSGPSVFFTPETTYRYRDISITKSYIFALYGGHSQVEFNQTGIMAEDILVFDHKGKPLWNLKLDRSIVEMVINEKTNEIYGLTTDEDPGIAVFDFPQEILKN
jgi:hypothetical protein